MKPIIHFLIMLLTISSCESQEMNQDITINYIAQTRGFLYSIQLNNNSLEINNNGILKKVALTKNQLTAINSEISKINFEDFKNNISQDELAVDSAIKGIFITKIDKKEYHFEFNHNKLPKEIQQLFTQLEDLMN